MLQSGRKIRRYLSKFEHQLGLRGAARCSKYQTLVCTEVLRTRLTDDSDGAR